CRFRAYVVVVQAPADQAAPQGKAIRADRARLADGAPSAAAAEPGLQAARPPRRDRDFLQASRAAHRGGARRPPRRRRSHRDYSDHRRGDRGAPDILGLPRLPAAAPPAPLLKPFMHTFLDQDRQVVVKQREGLVHRPRLMLINDADTQARWWMRVKDEWIAAQSEGRPFVNPLEPKTLRWRS